MNTTKIERQLVTNSIGNTAIAGFTLTKVDEGYEINDGTDACIENNAADALRTYADFIETFIDDQDEDTAKTWQAEINQARSDAEAL